MFLEQPRPSWAVPRRGAVRVDEPPLGEFMPVTWMSYAVDRLFWGSPRSRLPFDQSAAARPGGVGRVCAGSPSLRHALGADRLGHSAIDVSAAVAAPCSRCTLLRVEARCLGQRPRDGAGRAPPDPCGSRVRDWMGAQPRDRAEYPRGGSRHPRPFVALLLARATGLDPAAGAGWCWTSTRFAGSASHRRGGGVRRLAASGRRRWAFVVIGVLATPMGFLARGEELGDVHRAGWDPLISLAGGLHDRVLRVEDGRYRNARARSTACRRERTRWLGAVPRAWRTAVAATAILIATRRRGPWSPRRVGRAT